MFSYIFLAALAESIISFSGVLIAFGRSSFVSAFAHRILGFAIGALIGVAFFDIIPEVIEEIGVESSLLMIVSGILIFFAAEKLLRWYHHHAHDHEVRPYVKLVLMGDAVHNFIDGVAIAASFLVSTPLGIATTVAVLIHEIPQEIADFAILLRGGYSRTRALWYNFLISFTTLAGALLSYAFGTYISGILPYILGIVGGNFIYLALSDLIPETHEESGFMHFLMQFILMIGGAGLMFFLTRLLHE